MGKIETIMATSPYIEVMIRNLYWRLTPIVKWYNQRNMVKKSAQPHITSEKFIEHLSEQGIGKGNLLILHSSFSALRPGNGKHGRIIDLLLELIGSEGTLSMPAIPYFNNAPDVTRIMKADISELILDYDPLKTLSSTGVLPNVMCRYPGSVRSMHPLNTMVAIGPLAKPMMENNLAGDKPLPCGKNSSWHYCYLHNAKIVALGVDLTHSLTMIHVAEDMWDEEWVVPNWYRDRKFRIKLADGYKIVDVRERHPKWAMHFAARNLSKDLIRYGIMTKNNIDGVNVEMLEAHILVDYLNSKNGNAYPYFMVPRKSDTRVLKLTEKGYQKLL